MHDFFESFRKFLNEEKTVQHSNIWSVPVQVVISYESGRNKQEILSDIRAIEGVTIVTIIDQKDIATKDFSQLRIKIDTTPLPHKTLPLNLLAIKKKASQVKGVVRFEYNGRPEKIPY